MNVLVVGGGGREDALGRELNNEADRIFVAPGNAGTETYAENVPIEPTDVRELAKFAVQNNVDLAVIGPDDALAAGLIDRLSSAGIAAFGPKQSAACVETSKAFSKTLMRKMGIPTADFAILNNLQDALHHIRGAEYPRMAKADGLALGKGVKKCLSATDARIAIREMMIKRKFGSAGDTVIMEDFLEGQDISLHAFSDGETYSLTPAVQDHKEIYRNGTGPMTGGMGTIAPLPHISAEETKLLGEQFVSPALRGLKLGGKPFSGMLFPGLRLTPEGPKALEYNARFGDPETQALMRILKSGLLKTLIACTEGTLSVNQPEWSDKSVVCVVLASKGYPGTSTKGDVIEGLEEAGKQEGIIVYHAGTKRQGNEILTNGGRVLNVTATGDSIEAARTKVYDAIENYINFAGMQFRDDIGEKAMQGNLA